MDLKPLFSRRPSATNRDASSDWWFSRLSPPVAAGVDVTVEGALTLPVVYDCLQVLSQTIGALPFNIFERAPDGSKQQRDNHPLMAVLRDPNPETTDVEFLGQMVFDLASEGNFFAEIRSGRIGPISELWRHEPAKVQIERLKDGSKRFRVTTDDGSTKYFDDESMWHIKAFPHTEGGLRGTSPIHAGRETIGAALAVQRYSARFFDNDCTPPFVIKMTGAFKDTQSKDNFMSAISRWWSGRRKHGPALLEHGMEFQRVGVNNEEAQFNGTKQQLDNSIARIWRMPPHKVGILDRSTFSNIEQQALEFVTDTLLPWINVIEKSIRKHLIIASDRFFFEFNVAGLLRGDLKSRYDAYAQGRQWGWLSVNEIRKLENLNPVPGGDTRLQPMNMAPIGTAGTGEQASRPRPDHEIYGENGRAVSRIYGGNVVRIEDYRGAA